MRTDTRCYAALGKGRLRQILAYGEGVYGLGGLLGKITDSRKDPDVATLLVVRIVLLLALLRIRSFNALEPRLAEATLQRALGNPVIDKRLCSVDTLGYSLKRMNVATTRAAAVQIVRTAERNKVFREGWVGAMRCVALDAWEPHNSRRRCCAACLTRKVKVGKTVVTEYYHKYVVALLITDSVEVVIDMEEVRSADVRRELGDPEIKGHEGELTAAKRLVRRIRATYQRWIDVLVVDALYSNGPFLTVAVECGYSVIAVLKKENNEPLKEALALWRGQSPTVIDNPAKRERIELWDQPGLETLSTYNGPIRVVRAVVHREGVADKNRETSTWCFAVTGKASRRLSAAQIVTIGRGRWHIENTAFNQWTQHWKLSHVFTHGPNALPALFWVFILAFNLLQLFAYRQLGGYGRERGKEPTKTLIRLVDEMMGDLERLDETVSWNTS